MNTNLDALTKALDLTHAALSLPKLDVPESEEEAREENLPWGVSHEKP